MTTLDTDGLATLRLLSAARALIAQPGAWTKGWNARKADGTTCHAADVLAACWCADGAIQRVAGEDWESASAARKLLASAALVHVGGVPRSWAHVDLNDESVTVDGVLAAFDEAIAKAGAL